MLSERRQRNDMLVLVFAKNTVIIEAVITETIVALSWYVRCCKDVRLPVECVCVCVCVVAEASLYSCLEVICRCKWEKKSFMIHK